MGGDLMSELRVKSISDLIGIGPVDLVGQSAAKAYCSVTLLGTTAINESANFSSVIDEGAGRLAANLASGMSNSLFTATSGHHNSTTTSVGHATSVYTHACFAKDISTLRATTYRSDTNAYTDNRYVGSAIFGGLA